MENTGYGKYAGCRKYGLWEIRAMENTRAVENTGCGKYGSTNQSQITLPLPMHMVISMYLSKHYIHRCLDTSVTSNSSINGESEILQFGNIL